MGTPRHADIRCTRLGTSPTPQEAAAIPRAPRQTARRATALVLSPALAAVAAPPALAGTFGVAPTSPVNLQITYAEPADTASLVDPASTDANPLDNADADVPALRFAGASAYWENDSRPYTWVTTDDRHRTNAVSIEAGFRLSRDAYDDGARWLDFFDTWDAPRAAFGVQLRQFILTPEDIELEHAPIDDRPYAGWLTLGAFLQRAEGNTFDHLQLDLGVVGSYSLAEEAQTFVHAALPDQIKPRGWDDQLANELAINLRYERRWHFRSTESEHGIAADAIPYVGFRAGNVRTDAFGGALFRLGYNLPLDFGPGGVEGAADYTANRSPDFSIYGYARLQARAVARDIFLDGNTFADSRSVDRKDLVGLAQFGLEAAYRGFYAGWTVFFRTEEFEGQHGGDTTGQLTFGYRASF